jgi:catechol 2,3-dioxygenase-like lactoylglutathione lyase family enzyme
VLHSSDVIAFVATTDPERARRFYEAALGLPLLRDEPFALVFDANGTTLRVQKVRELHPAPYMILGWKVPDVRATVSSLEARGIRFERYPGLVQDDVGVWTSPSGARVAWFKDPDGHILSLTQE